MRTETISLALLYAGITFSALLFSSGNAQIAGKSSTITYGQSTNGIRGELEAVSIQGGLTELIVWVNCTNANGSVAETLRTNLAARDAIVEKFMSNDWAYYMPANSFSGPIELRNSLGVSVTALKPQVSASSAYPASYNLNDEYKKHFSHPFETYFGPRIFPFPLMYLAPRTEMVQFDVENISAAESRPATKIDVYQRSYAFSDYFDLKEPGEYTLTAWPKIYKRVATNSDICERIDLPPVSATFKWDENSK